MQLWVKYKDHFLVRAILLLGLYFALWYSPFMQGINAFLTENTADIAALLLRLFWEIPAEVLDVNPGYKWSVCTKGMLGVKIAHPCNAFELYCLYLGFLVAMSGVGLRRKWLFAIAGIMSIYAFNAMRVVGLFLIQGRWPDVFDFMHKYIFQASAYLLIFGLWYWMLKKHEA